MSSQDPSPDHLARLFELSLDLFCVAGFDGVFRSVNPAWERALGYPRDELTNRPFVELVHPDDRASTIAETEKLSSGVDTIRFENRYRHADGSYRWLQWSATPAAEQRLILAVARDITEDRALREELILHQRLTRTLAEVDDVESALRQVLTSIAVATGWTTAGAWLHSPDGATLEPSTAWFAARPGLESFRRQTEQERFAPGVGLVGRAWADRLPVWSSDVAAEEWFTRRQAADAAGLHAGVAIPVLGGGEVVAVLDFFVDRKIERDHGFVDLVSTVAGQLGEVVRRRQAERDLAAMANRFRELARIDDGTGLHNRRGFMELAEARLTLASRTGTPVTVLFVDLDGMKVINDTYGHAEGDEALREAADLLRGCVREADILGRLGGDEFAVALWGGAPAEARVRQRLEDAVERANARRRRPYDLRMSVGASIIDPGGETSLDDAIAEADRAMYHDKRLTSRD